MKLRLPGFSSHWDDDDDEDGRRGILARIPPYVLSAYLVACQVLGGGSNAAFVANAALQLIGLAIIFWLLVDRNVEPTPPSGKPLLWIGVAVIAVIMLQLVPLPPQFWAALSGREGIVHGFLLLGMRAPWMALSFDPEKTIASGLSLIPAAAVLFLMLRLRARGVRHVLPAIALTTLASVFVGIVQQVQGDDSKLYFYEKTNLGSMTGFFANSNHLATLLLMIMPFLAALFAGSSRRSSGGPRWGRHLIFTTGIILALIALAANHSVAGIALAGPTLIASLLLYLTGKKDLRAQRRLISVIGASLVLLVAGLVVVATLAPLPSMDDSTDHATVLRRPVIFANAARAGIAVFPFGSGLGTFQEIYPSYEDPATVTSVYINHSHNDYLEVFIELGLPGLLLFAAFFFWWLRRTIRVWWGLSEQVLLARAGSIASAVAMTHSIVDYPLRTAAVSTLFVFAIGLMVERPPIRRVRGMDGQTSHKARHIIME